MNIDKNFLRNLRPQIEIALQDIAEEHGIEITLGNCSFTAAVATFKLNVAVVGADGSVATKEAEDFKRYARAYGLKPDLLGQDITIFGNVYEIVGMKPKSRKYPVLGRRGGKIYKLPADAVKSAIEK